jgi:hypothetical protein
MKGSNREGLAQLLIFTVSDAAVGADTRSLAGTYLQSHRYKY